MTRLPVLALFTLVATSMDAGAADYTADPARSSLSFSGTQDGEPFEGRYRSFDARIVVDDATGLPTGITARIDVTSADTRNAERDQTLGTAEFFDYARFPSAQFRTLACRSAGAKPACDAELTIRDRTRPLLFPFTWTMQGDGRAKLEATVVVKRLQFDVGSGDWADTSMIGDDVTVRVSLALGRRP